MPLTQAPQIDLMPPPFHEGLDDWSRGDGTPETPTYMFFRHARLVTGDPDFGACLELRKVEAIQSLRYMGEVPVRFGSYLEVTARLRLLRGAAPLARIAAWPGGAQGRCVTDVQAHAPSEKLSVRGEPTRLRAVIGPMAGQGVDIVWDARVLYAHIGLDLTGPDGGIVRIEDISIRDISLEFGMKGPVLPGFEPPTPLRRSRPTA